MQISNNNTTFRLPTLVIMENQVFSFGLKFGTMVGLGINKFAKKLRKTNSQKKIAKNY